VIEGENVLDLRGEMISYWPGFSELGYFKLPRPRYDLTKSTKCEVDSNFNNSGFKEGGTTRLR